MEGYMLVVLLAYHWES